MLNTQCIVYYIKQVLPVDEPDAPYQGKIVHTVPAIPGYMPDEMDVQQYSPGDNKADTALIVMLCLN